MPELPEVETIVRDLRPHLVGQRLGKPQASRQALRRKWSPAWTKRIEGRKTLAIQRRGKWILLDLQGPWLLVHLGMTGQFLVTPAAQQRSSHTHLVFPLERGRSELRFRDIRRFGSVSLFPDRAALDRFFAASRLGPEPWDVAKDYWRASLARTSRCLKAVLLDQRVLAGVGNIYADESLFEARLHPGILARHLPAKKADALRQAVIAVLERAIARRGSSIRNFVDGAGEPGHYQNEFRVYGRTGEPCPRCSTPIRRIVLAGRSTHFCPRCQRLPRRIHLR